MSSKPETGDTPEQHPQRGGNGLQPAAPWWRNDLYRHSCSGAPWVAGSVLTTCGLGIAFYSIFRWAIAPAFAYGGIHYRTPNPLFLVVGFALASLLVLMLGRGRMDGGNFLSAVVIYALGVPAMIIPNLIAIENRSTSFGLVLFYFFPLALIAIGPRRLPKKRLPSMVLTEWVVVAGLLLLTAITFSMLDKYVGLHWRPVGFSDIYTARAEYAQRAAGAPKYLGYLIAIQMKAVGPSLLLIGLASRRWRPLIVLAVASQYLLYASTFAKQSLFSIFAIAALYLVFRTMREARPLAIGVGLFLVSATAGLLDILRGRVYWTEVIVDRFFFWPGFLPVQYYRTYQSHPYNLWGDSVLRHFVADQSPGSRPELLVGQGLTGKQGVFANTSFLGDGFANLGFGGVLVEALLLVALIYAFRVATRNLPIWATAPLLVMPAVSIINGSPFTALFSGALLPVLAVFLLSPTALLGGDDYRRASLVVVRRSRRLRVTLVTGYFDEFSGYLEVSLARELSKQCDVVVITGDRVAPAFSDPTLDTLGRPRHYPKGPRGQAPLTVIRLPYFKVGSLLVPKGILRTLMRMRSDAVLLLAPGQGFSFPAAWMPSRALRVAIFGDNRAQWTATTPVRLRLKWIIFSATKGILYRIIIARADIVYGITPNTLTRLSPFDTASRMRLWPLPVDAETFRFDPLARASLRSRHGFDGPVLGIVGRVTPEKELERVLSAFVSIARDEPDCSLVIAGLGEDRYSTTLRNMVANESLLAARCTLMGHLNPERLAEVMSAVDVCVWPVQPAITIQQALMSGCRIVVPDNDLVGFLADGGALGSTFDPGDWEGMRSAMSSEVQRCRSQSDREYRAARAGALAVAQQVDVLVHDLETIGDF